MHCEVYKYETMLLDYNFNSSGPKAYCVVGQVVGS